MNGQKDQMRRQDAGLPGPPPLPDESPFHPSAGRPPPCLGGREHEQARLLGMLKGLAEGAPPDNHPFLFGPRGSGKTVLLNWLADQTKRLNGKRPIDIVRLTLAEFRSWGALVHALSLRGREASSTEAVESGVSAKAGIPALGGIAGKGRKTSAVETEWRRPTLDEALHERTSGMAGDGKRALLIILDELHEVPAQCADAPNLDPLQGLLNALQNTDAVLLAMAGTPDAEDRLTSARATFVGRMVKPHGWLAVGRLDQRDAMQALFQPFAALGRRPFGASDEDWGGDLAGTAFDACSGHPHFIQLLGEALFEQIDPNSPVIDAKALHQALSEFHQWRDQHHAERYAEMERGGLVECAAEVGKLMREERQVGRTELGKGEFRECVRAGLRTRRAGRYDADEAAAWVQTNAEAQNRLRHLGFVWGGAAGAVAERLVIGIPCLADYALNRGCRELPHVAKRMSMWQPPSEEQKSRESFSKKVWDLNRT